MYKYFQKLIFSENEILISKIVPQNVNKILKSKKNP